MEETRKFFLDHLFYSNFFPYKKSHSPSAAITNVILHSSGKKADRERHKNN